MSKEASVRKGIATVADHTESRLEFCTLDLLHDDGWREAEDGCDYMLHVASPFYVNEPKDEGVFVKPAVEGTKRAMKFAKMAGVKKVVVTSSIVAMMSGKDTEHLTENSWADTDGGRMSAYGKSKALAERAAWDVYNQQKGEKMELTVINPGPVFGPTLTGHIGSSLEIIKNMMTGKMPQQPKTSMVLSDVRDIAKLHVSALEVPASDGRRLIVTTETAYPFSEIAAELKRLGYEKATAKTAPTLMLKVLSFFNSEVKAMMPLVGKQITADISPSREMFNWEPVPFETSIRDSAESVSAWM